jgi:hypothetical protein
MGRPTKTYPKFASLLKSHIEKKHPKDHGQYSWLATLINVKRNTVRNWLEFDGRPGEAETVICIAGHLGLTQEQCKALLKAAEYTETLEDYKVIFEKGTTEAAGQALKFINEWLDNFEGLLPSATFNAIPNERRVAFIEETIKDSNKEPSGASNEKTTPYSKIISETDRTQQEKKLHHFLWTLNDYRLPSVGSFPSRCFKM